MRALETQALDLQEVSGLETELNNTSLRSTLSAKAAYIFLPKKARFGQIKSPAPYWELRTGMNADDYQQRIALQAYSEYRRVFPIMAKIHPLLRKKPTFHFSANLSTTTEQSIINPTAVQQIRSTSGFTSIRCATRRTVPYSVVRYNRGQACKPSNTRLAPLLID